MNSSFTVILSVYKNDDPVLFKNAVDSIIKQTLVPGEIIIGIDGPIEKDLADTISLYNPFSFINIIPFTENRGPGKVRHECILRSKYDTVAVMDSDDISVPNRFELQISHLQRNPEVDIIGGFIEEFISKPGDINRIRRVKLTHSDILKDSKWRQAMNHVTIMFKKAGYLKTGGYMGLRKTEDFDLFHKMFINGLIFANLPEILVYARFAEEHFYKRRGLTYLKEELAVFREMKNSGHINLGQYYSNYIIRVLTRLMPAQVLKLVYKKFLRY
ncbi:MAG: glycosyltransferase [Sphingobacteriaceae bacterium]|nr:glycosyltransferase [Sphingobacteriaceae bacterium]